VSTAAFAAFVTGRTGTIGSLLVPLLLKQGISVQSLGRKPLAEGERLSGLQCFSIDLASPPTEIPGDDAETLLHTTSLWLLPGWLEKFHARGVRRVIAFSSTSRFTKQASTSPYETQVVNKLVAAEDHVAAECERLGMAWTIFRPTLIYGGAGGDRNVADIARLIRKFGCFPLFGTASGRRQPVHARDLALACMQSLANPTSYNKAYNLSGGETLAYRDMVKRVFETLGRQPRFIRIPMPVFSLAVTLARLHPRFAHLTPDMALRMQADLVFDHADATRDFGYNPGPFDPAYLTTLR
jgi:nucleoside-diphosphate-sugar epimerase